MKNMIIFLIGTVCCAPRLQGQGEFMLCNATAPTRWYDGSLAGPGVWGHFFVGGTEFDLFPFDRSREHTPNGFVSSYLVVATVPGFPILATVYVQMVAWDGRTWGTSLAAVPLDQLGKTDIVPVVLSGLSQPHNSPEFTQPAIVPPIPEPSVASICLVGSALAFAANLRRSRRVAPGVNRR